jgi:pimeloyl-ACP methyl ester carboxylesterase
MDAFVDNGVVRINYQALGSGRPLVLLHGYSLDSQAWQDMGYVEPLIKAGFCPILVDIRGHGASGKPHDSGAYTEEQQAGDVAAVLDALVMERGDLMGYSRGGRMALDFARLFPEKADRLVIGGAHPFVQDLSLFRVAVAGGIEGWIGVIEGLGGPLPAALRSRIAANDIEALRAAVAVDRPDVSSSFQGFPRPCLFFAGTDDPLRSQIERAAGLLPHARMVEIRGCNHMTALQRADLVLPPVLQFLTDGRRL